MPLFIGASVAEKGGENKQSKGKENDSMKDIYNHMVYYLFSLVLLCTPPRVSAEETPPEKKDWHKNEKLRPPTQKQC